MRTLRVAQRDSEGRGEAVEQALNKECSSKDLYRIFWCAVEKNHPNPCSQQQTYGRRLKGRGEDVAEQAVRKVGAIFSATEIRVLKSARAGGEAVEGNFLSIESYRCGAS